MYMMRREEGPKRRYIKYLSFAMCSQYFILIGPSGPHIGPTCAFTEWQLRHNIFMLLYQNYQVLYCILQFCLSNDATWCVPSLLDGERWGQDFLGKKKLHTNYKITMNSWYQFTEKETYLKAQSVNLSKSS